MIFVRMLHYTQPMLQELITWTRLQNILLI